MFAHSPLMPYCLTLLLISFFDKGCRLKNPKPEKLYFWVARVGAEIQESWQLLATPRAFQH